MPTRSITRPQFSLAALLGAVIACGVIFGFIANMETSYFVSIRCDTVPEDDQKLAIWFKEQDGVEDVSTLRDGNTINVEYTKRHVSFELAMPPLAELGYTGLQGWNSTISRASVGGAALNWASKIPVLVWFAVAAVLTTLLARKIIRCRMSSVTRV